MRGSSGCAAIGCNTPTCTQPLADGEDERDRCRVNHENTKCGIHTLNRSN
jgi:hypothetical protein